MAYTKIIVIHNRLDRCLNYTQDEEKASLETVLDYAMNRDKTEQDCFETALNCDWETAYADMMDTKRRWGKASRKRKGYHVIQSFAPGEVTPEQAHAISSTMPSWRSCRPGTMTASTFKGRPRTGRRCWLSLPLKPLVWMMAWMWPRWMLTVWPV